mmetsp:Transcript_8913/g.36051  ORF Transcript_8913/g.36051 Transcript_8913/m.36051 type:complete len:206 (-) Transcript_8913:614-1231(-)
MTKRDDRSSVTTASGNDQKGCGWHHAKSGTSTHAPEDRCWRQRAPMAATSASADDAIASMVSIASFTVASETKVGCALTRSVTLLAHPPAINASASARSHVSSNPALSTTMLTFLFFFVPPAVCRLSAGPSAPRRRRAAACESSERRYFSPDESASAKAFAARSPFVPPPSFPPSSGQMLRSMRLPHSATMRNRRTSSAVAADPL